MEKTLYLNKKRIKKLSGGMIFGDDESVNLIVDVIKEIYPIYNELSDLLKQIKEVKNKNDILNIEKNFEILKNKYNVIRDNPNYGYILNLDYENELNTNNKVFVDVEKKVKSKFLNEEIQQKIEPNLSKLPIFVSFFNPKNTIPNLIKKILPLIDEKKKILIEQKDVPEQKDVYEEMFNGIEYNLGYIVEEIEEIKQSTDKKKERYENLLSTLDKMEKIIVEQKNKITGKNLHRLKQYEKEIIRLSQNINNLIKEIPSFVPTPTLPVEKVQTSLVNKEDESVQGELRSPSKEDTVVSSGSEKYYKLQNLEKFFMTYKKLFKSTEKIYKLKRNYAQNHAHIDINVTDDLEIGYPIDFINIFEPIKSTFSKYKYIVPKCVLYIFNKKEHHEQILDTSGNDISRLTLENMKNGGWIPENNVYLPCGDGIMYYLLGHFKNFGSIIGEEQTIINSFTKLIPNDNDDAKLMCELYGTDIFAITVDTTSEGTSGDEYIKLISKNSEILNKYQVFQFVFSTLDYDNGLHISNKFILEFYKQFIIPGKINNEKFKDVMSIYTQNMTTIEKGQKYMYVNGTNYNMLELDEFKKIKTGKSGHPFTIKINRSKILKKLSYEKHASKLIRDSKKNVKISNGKKHKLLIHLIQSKFLLSVVPNGLYRKIEIYVKTSTEGRSGSGKIVPEGHITIEFGEIKKIYNEINDKLLTEKYGSILDYVKILERDMYLYIQTEKKTYREKYFTADKINTFGQILEKEEQGLEIGNLNLGTIDIIVYNFVYIYELIVQIKQLPYLFEVIFKTETAKSPLNKNEIENNNGDFTYLQFDKIINFHKNMLTEYSSYFSNSEHELYAQYFVSKDSVSYASTIFFDIFKKFLEIYLSEEYTVSSFNQKLFDFIKKYDKHYRHVVSQIYFEYWKIVNTFYKFSLIKYVVKERKDIGELRPLFNCWNVIQNMFENRVPGDNDNHRKCYYIVQNFLTIIENVNKPGPQKFNEYEALKKVVNYKTKILYDLKKDNSFDMEKLGNTFKLVHFDTPVRERKSVINYISITNELFQSQNKIYFDELNQGGAAGAPTTAASESNKYFIKTMEKYYKKIYNIIYVDEGNNKINFYLHYIYKLFETINIETVINSNDDIYTLIGIIQINMSSKSSIFYRREGNEFIPQYFDKGVVNIDEMYGHILNVIDLQLYFCGNLYNILINKILIKLYEYSSILSEDKLRKLHQNVRDFLNGTYIPIPSGLHGEMRHNDIEIITNMGHGKSELITFDTLETAMYPLDTGGGSRFYKSKTLFKQLVSLRDWIDIETENELKNPHIRPLYSFPLTKKYMSNSVQFYVQIPKQIDYYRLGKINIRYGKDMTYQDIEKYNLIINMRRIMGSDELSVVITEFVKEHNEDLKKQNYILEGAKTYGYREKIKRNEITIDYNNSIMTKKINYYERYLEFGIFHRLSLPIFDKLQIEDKTIGKYRRVEEIVNFFSNTASGCYLRKQRHYIYMNTPSYNYIFDKTERSNFAEYDGRITSKIYDRILLLRGKVGCGKTSNVPLILYEAETLLGSPLRKRNIKNIPISKIVCTQPRIVNADEGSKRVASSSNSSVPGLVGINTGTKKLSGNKMNEVDKTYIMFMTEAELLQQLINTPESIFNKYEYFVLDEVHERNLEMDLLLFLLKKYMKIYTTFKVIIMSATFNVSYFARYFDLFLNFEEDEKLTNKTKSIINKKYFSEKLDQISKKQLIDKKKIEENKIIDKSFLEYRTNLITQKLAQIKNESDEKLLHKIYSNFINIEFQLNVVDIEGTKGTVDEHFLDVPTDNYCQTTIDLIKNKILPESPDINTPNLRHILIFVPGMKEISLIYDTLRDMVGTVDIRGRGASAGTGTGTGTFNLLKYSSKIDENERTAVTERRPLSERKIIISTNIAEVGLTIEDLRYVIDSGWGNMVMFDPQSGAKVIGHTQISENSAIQRRGRVGRTGIGQWYPMYTENTFKFKLDPFGNPSIYMKEMDTTVLHVLKILESNDFGGKTTTVGMGLPIPLSRTLKDMTLLDRFTSTQIINYYNILSRYGVINPDTSFLTKIGETVWTKLILPTKYINVLLRSVEMGCSYEMIYLLAMYAQDDEINDRAWRPIIRVEVAVENNGNTGDMGGDTGEETTGGSALLKVKPNGKAIRILTNRQRREMVGKLEKKYGKEMKDKQHIIDYIKENFGTIETSGDQLRPYEYKNLSPVAYGTAIPLSDFIVMYQYIYEIKLKIKEFSHETGYVPGTTYSKIIEWCKRYNILFSKYVSIEKFAEKIFNTCADLGIPIISFETDTLPNLKEIKNIKNKFKTSDGTKFIPDKMLLFITLHKVLQDTIGKDQYGEYVPGTGAGTDGLPIYKLSNGIFATVNNMSNLYGAKGTMPIPRRIFYNSLVMKADTTAEMKFEINHIGKFI